MSRNRNLAKDRAETARLIQSPNRSHTTPNWLGHRGGAGKIDNRLLDGATRSELDKLRGAVEQHLKHLRDSHGLHVEEPHGILRFNRRHLGLRANLGAVKPRPPQTMTLNDPRTHQSDSSPGPLNKIEQLLNAAAKPPRGGESEEHRRLKDFVGRHPEVVGLPPSIGPGQLEVELPSADRVDVVFDDGIQIVAVEVKSRLSDATDVARGLFQCVKYAAVITANQLLRGEHRSVRSVLALERELPRELKSSVSSLGVAVFQMIKPY